jgi:hypothetical protein
VIRMLIVAVSLALFAGWHSVQQSGAAGPSRVIVPNIAADDTPEEYSAWVVFTARYRGISLIPDPAGEVTFQAAYDAVAPVRIGRHPALSGPSVAYATPTWTVSDTCRPAGPAEVLRVSELRTYGLALDSAAGAGDTEVLIDPAWLEFKQSFLCGEPGNEVPFSPPAISTLDVWKLFHEHQKAAGGGYLITGFAAPGAGDAACVLGSLTYSGFDDPAEGVTHFETVTITLVTSPLCPH